MKRLILLVVVLAVPALASAQVADSLLEQVKIREIILAGQIEDMVEVRADLTEAWARLEQQSGSLMQAQREGESVDSLRLRDEGLRQVEMQLLADVSRAQELRRSMLAQDRK